MTWKSVEGPENRLFPSHLMTVLLSDPMSRADMHCYRHAHHTYRAGHGVPYPVVASALRALFRDVLFSRASRGVLFSHVAPFFRAAGGLHFANFLDPCAGSNWLSR